MDSRPLPAGWRGTCPCCGTPDRFLFVCKQCDWSAAPEPARMAAKQRVEKFSLGTAILTYNPRGCSICETCWSQMGGHALACPLRLFYEAGLAAADRSLPADQRFGDTICGQWEQWLAERDWPEVTEIYWRRLVDYMVSEKEQA